MLANDPSDVTVGLILVIERILELDRGPSAVVQWVRDQLHSGHGLGPAHDRPSDEQLVHRLTRELAERLLKYYLTADTLEGQTLQTFLALPGKS